MPQINPLPTIQTGIPWLDALLAAMATPAMIGPAAVTAPVIKFPLMQSSRGILGATSAVMGGQPRGMPLVGPRVSPAGMVGASVTSEPQLLTAADRFRGPLSEAMPIEKDIVNLISMLRDALLLSSRQ